MYARGHAIGREAGAVHDGLVDDAGVRGVARGVDDKGLRSPARDRAPDAPGVRRAAGRRESAGVDLVVPLSSPEEATRASACM